MMNRDVKTRSVRCFLCNFRHDINVSCSRAATLRARRDIGTIALLAAVFAIAALCERAVP
jgi:hypothetical protein